MLSGGVTRLRCAGVAAEEINYKFEPIRRKSQISAFDIFFFDVNAHRLGRGAELAMTPRIHTLTS